MLQFQLLEERICLRYCVSSPILSLPFKSLITSYFKSLDLVDNVYCFCIVTNFLQFIVRCSIGYFIAIIFWIFMGYLLLCEVRFIFYNERRQSSSLPIYAFRRPQKVTLKIYGRHILKSLACIGLHRYYVWKTLAQGAMQGCRPIHSCSSSIHHNPPYCPYILTKRPFTAFEHSFLSHR